MNRKRKENIFLIIATGIDWPNNNKNEFSDFISFVFLFRHFGSFVCLVIVKFYKNFTELYNISNVIKYE